ncbi:hypothetical protein [Sulfurihydrogenibium sp.]|uniref:hypothetical protein n=1 Tax=Sulfurihydrogenibium sp. TaxID=2053621 RepID=UPI0026259A7A|nr:hypothetical protein [Sulfurihydrogenibium sp.]
MKIDFIKNSLKTSDKKEKGEVLDENDYYLESELEKIKKSWNVISFIEKVEKKGILPFEIIEKERAMVENDISERITRISTLKSLIFNKKND